MLQGTANGGKRKRKRRDKLQAPSSRSRRVRGLEFGAWSFSGAWILVLGAFALSYYIPAMPTYEYICEKCGDHFEIFQSISAKALTTCPKEKCTQKVWGKGKVKRAISGGAGLIFKGSGFYITDYRSDKYKEAAKKESGSTTPAAGETKSAGTGESKAGSKSTE